MTGDVLVIDDREWLTEIVEHWPPGGPSDRPTAYDVIFYDPEDWQCWVANSRVPAEAADLSEQGLYRLFRDATVRTWRDAAGVYWRIRAFRAGASGAGGDGEGVEHDGDGLSGVILSFHPRQSSGSRMLTRSVGELPPIGRLGDERLERLIAKTDAGSSPRLDAGGAARRQEPARRMEH